MTDDDRKPPCAIESERVVLAAALYDPHDLAIVDRLVADEDWYVTQHLELWQIIRALGGQGAADFTALRAEISKNDETARRLMPVLLRLTDASLTIGSADWHCKRIVDTATARTVLADHLRGAQQIQDGLDPVLVSEDTIEALRKAQRRNDRDDSGTVLDFLDVVDRVVDPAKFVIPGLLARANRIIITAPEGYGKSSLLRQIAACGAGGVHPFDPQRVIRPITALVVDAENPEDINTTEYQRVASSLEKLDRMPSRGMLTVDECGPINLLDARHAARLYSLVERIQPELVVIGPLYKLHEENPNDEGPARKLSAVLDRLVDISGAALVTEAHTPHNDGPMGQLLRPFGASLWKRWPDFGYCLHPAVRPKDPANPTADEMLSLQMRESRFTPWRGLRAARAWPSALSIGHVLPWEPHGTYQEGRSSAYHPSKLNRIVNGET